MLDEHRDYIITATRFEYLADPGDEASTTATVVISLASPGYDPDPRTRGRASGRGPTACPRYRGRNPHSRLMCAQVAPCDDYGPGQRHDAVSHGKEKLNDGRMTEAPEWTICAHLNCPAGQPDQRKYSALGVPLYRLAAMS